MENKSCKYFSDILFNLREFYLYFHIYTKNYSFRKVYIFSAEATIKLLKVNLGLLELSYRF